MKKTLSATNKNTYINDLIKQTSAGDGGAASLLGDAYREGDGVEQSWEQAFRWYTLGARAGDIEAQNNLGTLYLEGFYCPEDHEQAVYWYRKSAEQGANVAQYNLAMRYIHGQGVPVDYAEAMRWLEMSANQGYNLANFDLGVMHLHGEGCVPDRIKALKFLIKGGNGGDERALTTLANKVPEMEKMAIEGDMDDWLAISNLYYEHLKLSDSKARGWAWLLWSEAHLESAISKSQRECLELWPDDEEFASYVETAGGAGMGCNLIEIMTDRSKSSHTSQADKEKGEKLFRAMMYEREIALPSKPASDMADAAESNDPASPLAKWLEACDANAPIEKRFSEARPSDELILELAAEGGGLNVFGTRGSDESWSFWCDLNDSTPTLEGDPAINRASDLVYSWDAAIASLDNICNHWMKLYPCYVHPEFRKPLLELVERRLIVSRLVGGPEENQ